MEHGSLKSGLLIIPKREAHGNTIYDATSTLSVTVYFDATRTIVAILKQTQCSPAMQPILIPPVLPQWGDPGVR
jgi:hypothetical protein